MTWIPLLLADRSPNLRYLILRRLLNFSEDEEEVLELQAMREDDPLASSIIKSQNKDGSWSDLDGAEAQRKNPVRSTALSLLRLGYLGFPKEHPTILNGVEYIFRAQQRNGTWPIPHAYDGISEPKRQYTMVPLQTSLPLLGIAASGHSTDERAEIAYEWLLDQRLDDGSWPAGKIGEVYGYQAGYRKMPHTQWGCRTNTTLALTCLAYHPQRRTSAEAKRALDLLLARETRDRRTLGFNTARIIGFEQHRGNLTYHANFDPALVLDLCGRIGANRSDARVDELVSWIQQQQNKYGLWEYETRPEASRWISYDLLYSLSRIDEQSEWFSSELRTRYASYKSKKKRF
ncbi:MAG: hypothetical protein ACFFED_12260 [Candidatus Thorarchaeota archaeon]